MDQFIPLDTAAELRQSTLGLLETGMGQHVLLPIQILTAPCTDKVLWVDYCLSGKDLDTCTGFSAGKLQSARDMGLQQLSYSAGIHIWGSISQLLLLICFHNQSTTAISSAYGPRLM